METPPYDKDALVKRLIEARNALLAVARDLPEARRSQPARPDGWSPKDIVGHIASWENRYITLIQHLINGHADRIEWLRGDEEVDAWNRREYLRKRDWSWDEVIRDLALIREELLWNLGWATPEQVFQEHRVEGGSVSVARFLEGLIEHDGEHLAELTGGSAA